MPRRRATKINVRATPKVSRSTDADKLSEKERVDKMQVFLSDYDEKVAVQLKTMEEEKKRMLQIVSRRLHLQIMQMPWDVRKMTLHDFIAAGGTIEAVSGKQALSDDMKESTVFKSNGNRYETIHEEQSEFTVPKATTGRRKQYGTGANKMRGHQEAMSAIKSSFKTPHTTHVAAGWDTPLITPKFDPRLPFQSHNSRDPKPGERLVSLQGSPVAISNKQGPHVKLTDNHLTLNVDLTEELTLDDIDIDLDENYIKKMMTIFSQISTKLAAKRESTMQ
ncbi:borealin-like [Gigantopelta aegis]|uniref:borealin-like n=1 Tax=Gigantopelta aegis TaxID=1735272 RepID=UPI001B88908C|nr:borealin-like [Gigantopelta aegis]XP_041376111.1 borealin-like [Gigantopelta aegis]XP_041376112.1 borealin-like [Gigantopelta aegis]